MKNFARIFQLSVVMAAWFIGPAFAQPASPQPQPRLHIDPLTGLPVATSTNNIAFPTDFINPATGRLWAEDDLPVEAAPLLDSASDLDQQARTLLADEQYEQALQCFQKLYAQTNSGLANFLADWIELGGKYPKARQALIDIRDQDARLFSLNQGTFKMFQELCDVNGALCGGAANYALFMDLRQKQPSLAAECYLIMEPTLVQRGEYQLCLEYIGNPETRIKTYCQTFQRLHALFEGMSERSKEMWRNIQASHQQPGRPPLSPYLHINAGKKGLRLTTDQFTGEVCRLIEILVGTGHQEEAGEIHGEAVAVLDDPRLRTAVSDAEEKIQKRSVPAVIPERK